VILANLRKRLRSAVLGPLVRKHLHSGETLLDVGGGSGLFARWLRDHAGVDATVSDLVDYGDHRDGSLPFLRQEEIRRISAPDKSFDVVLLMFVLHHLDTAELQEQLVLEAARVARKRVIVLEDTPASSWDWGMNTMADWVLNVRFGIPTPFTFRSTRNWCETFSRNRIGLAAQETFRSVWPTFGLYRQSLFVLVP
jgi:ubiquinone/menaquinone biosynthesis C-methylase UbiE